MVVFVAVQDTRSPSLDAPLRLPEWGYHLRPHSESATARERTNAAQTQINEAKPTIQLLT